MFLRTSAIPMMGRAANACAARDFHFVIDAFRALKDPTYDWTGLKPLAIKQLRQDIEAALGRSLTEFELSAELGRIERCQPMFTEEDPPLK